jgi:hypothetical protein
VITPPEISSSSCRSRRGLPRSASDKKPRLFMECDRRKGTALGLPRPWLRQPSIFASRDISNPCEPSVLLTSRCILGGSTGVLREVLELDDRGEGRRHVRASD